MIRRCVLCGLVAIACCGRSALAAECSIRLIDVSGDLGLQFKHTDGGSGQQYIVELMVAGLAAFDYDNDGLIDLYFLNGARRSGATDDAPPANALYRNNGDWTFTDVTQSAGVGDVGHGLGVTIGDYDNDGNADIYLNNNGPNVLYHNQGDGTFRDASREAGLLCGDRVGAGTCFLDADADGDLDLYVANYVDFTVERHKRVAAVAFPYPPGPSDYPPLADCFFRNESDGTFQDISQEAGINTVAAPSMGMVCFDYDSDGDTDVFVCNDGVANYLFDNDGTGRFVEQGLLLGAAYNLHGEANGSMGVDCGDFDNDGRIDMFMTDYTAESPVLYRNHPAGFFEDATNLAGVGAAVFAQTNWGTGMVDFDNDGDRDLFIASGHFLSNIPDIDQRASYRAANSLLMNLGNGRYRDVTADCGNGLTPVQSSRGAAFDDLDNDGNQDAAILNANTTPTILRNRSATGNHWIGVRLHGVTCNRDGVGSLVKVAAGELTQVAEVHSGRSYQSHYGTRLHFGLGTRQRVDRVEVRWLGGAREVFTNLRIDDCVDLVQGNGASQ